MRISDWSSDVCSSDLITAPVAVIVGNPPFESSLTTEGAKRSYAAYIKEHGALADKQLAYLFLHAAMEMLAPNGVLAMVEPAGFLYNQDRKSVVEGRSVSVRVELGGSRNIKKKK